ncbi:TonB-dependent receptor domain-containing protein [Pseudoxanthomonas mexicana]|uniref:TonB-dependent receptor domain-containing protein n=1 Tax=Pseudoxanthomonas mexicana TaxID=128785 RepID=UPI00398A83D0
MTFRRHPLGSALQLILGTLVIPVPALAAEAAMQDAKTLDAVQVVAIGEDQSRIAAPYSVVSGDDLQASGAATLGEALNGLPGVHADTFGSGSSRPVIRGQVGPRVKVLSDSASVLDASDISPDHAVTVDPLLGERVEVLRGPATLLYGGGAIGGVVNVLDNRIPTRLPEGGLEGRLALRGNTVAGEKAAAAAVSAQAGAHLVLHAEGSYRDADSYKSRGWDESRVDGTFAESRNASAGLSWVTDNGYLGLAYSWREDDYGLPGHSHEYEGCHPHGSALHCGSHDHDDGDDHDHDHDHAHEDVPVINLVSKRVDLRGEYRDPFAGISRIRLRASHTDYRHDEIDEGEVTTAFANKGYEGRVEVEHAPIGDWTGVFGVQHSDTRFSAEGVEAFLPQVDTRSTGVFLVEHFEPSEQWHFEIGARHEWLEHRPVDDPRNRPRFDDTATSFSGAAIWEFRPDVSLTFSAAHSERLPHAQELYARGIHMATNTYECGLLPHALTCGGAANDAWFGKESSRNLELMLRKSVGDLTFSVGGFSNDIDDYIHARTLDQYEDFRLIKYSQRDAEFRGWEAEVDYRFNDVLSAGVFADRVHARFADGGGNVPRIPAARVGGRVNVDLDSFSGEVELYHVSRQHDIADFESATPGHDMLNLTLDYRIGDGRARLFLRGANLLDEKVWNHTSFLASAVPLPGRNLSVGLTYDF